LQLSAANAARLRKADITTATATWILLTVNARGCFAP
jgi:hypothetical protein